LPNVPTTAQAGLTNAEFPIWFGLFAPARTPRHVVEKLHDQTLKAEQTGNVKDKLTQLAVDPMNMTADQFAAFVAKEVAANAALVKMAGVKAQAD
jgi:tripartite-type tricarboxylate transporter receptor subunit TctC